MQNWRGNNVHSSNLDEVRSSSEEDAGDPGDGDVILHQEQPQWQQQIQFQPTQSMSKALVNVELHNPPVKHSMNTNREGANVSVSKSLNRIQEKYKLLTPLAIRLQEQKADDFSSLENSKPVVKSANDVSTESSSKSAILSKSEDASLKQNTNKGLLCEILPDEVTHDIEQPSSRDRNVVM